MLQCLPAAFSVLFESLFKTRCGGDHTIFEAGRVDVTSPVERSQHTFIELGAFLQHSLRRFKARILKTRDLGNLFNVGDMLNVEKHVFEGGFVGHVLSRESGRFGVINRRGAEDAEKNGSGE